MGTLKTSTDRHLLERVLERDFVKVLVHAADGALELVGVARSFHAIPSGYSKRLRSHVR